MKVRIKFSKTGPMKFVGHLDMMRYFQKALRRADFDVTFSSGYSPHMVMSFASPLGVGVESMGEYFDLELNSATTSKDMIARLNEAMVDGVEVFDIIQIPEEKASKAMSLVSAADYKITFRGDRIPCANWKERFTNYMSQDHIMIVKKTKKSEQEIDLRPLVFEWNMEDDSIICTLSAGSVANLKPELLMEGFYQFLGLELDPLDIAVMRLEVYSITEDGLVPLSKLGEIIE